MKNLLVVLSLTILWAASSSCQKQDDIQEQKQINLDEKSTQLIEADNSFGLKLFQKISESSEEENRMISPLSISIALAMAYNGAQGVTESEMQNTLELNGLTSDEINSSYKNLISALKSLDDDVTFNIANAIFHDNEFPFKSDFITINQNFYDAEVSGLDFSLPSTVETINNWVAQKTNDKIPTIVDKIDKADVMILLNAVYFNGIWKYKFDEEGTHNQPFRMVDGTEIEVPMMSTNKTLNYTSNSLFKAIQLPYGTGQYNMHIVLPNENKSTQDIIENLTTENWANWINEFTLTENVHVRMPRFKFEFKSGLVENLKSLGMNDAFSAKKANFNKISDISLFISDVKHKSFIDVNETGTEAAAVTAITFGTTSAGEPIEIVPFIVNKPFLFAITEKDTGAILFIGSVSNPEYEN